MFDTMLYSILIILGLGSFLYFIKNNHRLHMMPNFKLEVTKEEKDKLLKIQNITSYAMSFAFIIPSLIWFIFEINIFNSIIVLAILIVGNRLLKRELKKIDPNYLYR